jgi:hypothetical protein
MMLALPLILGIAAWSSYREAAANQDRYAGRSDTVLKQQGPAPSLNDSRPGDGQKSWTKTQFSRAIDGMTKAQVRAQFGSPGQVADNSDEWTYFQPPIYDDAAGTKIMWVVVKFEGLDDPAKDGVAEVSFN